MHGPSAVLVLLLVATAVPGPGAVRPASAQEANAGAPMKEPPAPAAETVRLATVPFTLDHNRLIVQVRLVCADGAPRLAHAWVDTGSQYLAVAESLAVRLGLDTAGLRPEGSLDSVDSGSPAPSVQLGELRLDTAGLAVKVCRGSHVLAGVPAELTLPAAAFRRDCVVFDYPARRLSVARPGTLSPRGAPVPCRVNGETGLFLIAADLDGEAVAMGVDTGSAGTWVSADLTAAWRARHPDWPHCTGALGSANFFGFPFEAQGTLMQLPELRIGALSARDIAVLGLPQGLFDWYSRKSAAAVAGFIGGNVLKGFRLTVDFPNGMTYWEPGPAPAAGDLDIVGLTLRPEADGGFSVAGVATRDGKAAVAGIQPGDRLLRVDALATTGALMGQVIDALRGEPGAPRRLLIERDGKPISVDAPVARFP